jgi:hypothetical protein
LDPGDDGSTSGSEPSLSATVINEIPWGEEVGGGPMSQAPSKPGWFSWGDVI